MDIVRSYLNGDYVPSATEIKTEMVRLAKEGRGPVTRKDAIAALERAEDEILAGIQEGEMRAERMMDFVMGGGDPEDAAWALATGWA
jgi:hypothetical protein